jgi:acyl-CoA hydrolase
MYSVGKTSMEVEVLVEAENTISGHIETAAKGHLTYVALDGNGRPKVVPPFYPQTAEEAEKVKAAESRRALRRLWR